MRSTDCAAVITHCDMCADPGQLRFAAGNEELLLAAVPSQPQRNPSFRTYDGRSGIDNNTSQQHGRRPLPSQTTNAIGRGRDDSPYNILIGHPKPIYLDGLLRPLAESLSEAVDWLLKRLVARKNVTTQY